jgi:hypothetical protein
MDIYCCFGPNQRDCEQRDVGDRRTLHPGSDAGAGYMHSGFPNDARSELDSPAVIVHFFR